MRADADPVGRPHPGADDEEDRRDHELDVDHRGAQEDDRLLGQVLQHADRDRRPQERKVRRDARRPQRQDHRRPGFDDSCGLRQKALHRGRRDQGIPDAGRGQPGSRRRPHRRDAGRFDRARRLPEIRAGHGLLRPQGPCRRRSRNPRAGRRRRRAQGRHGVEGKDQRRDQGHPRQRQI